MKAPILALGLALLGGQAAAQTIDSALARLNRNDTAGALTALEALKTTDAGNIRVWRNLGLLYYAKHRTADAVGAWQQVLRIDSTSLGALYNIGLAYADARDTANAFAWFGRAKATHRVDMTALTQDSSLVWLWSHPRYRTLLPERADFDHPFVEDTRIVHEFDGEVANDQFGWIARDIGDVDGDGAHDFTTSAPTSGAGGRNAGRVYVYSSRTGRELWHADGEPGGQLGSGLEAAGDVNHDGIPDVVASAPYGGYARVYSGRDGRVLLELRSSDPPEAFGLHTEGVGDVNGDGYADILVGAPRSSVNGHWAGRAYLYSGRDGSLLFTWSGDAANQRFGSAVAGATANGRSQIIIGAPGAGPNGHGRVYVYEGMSATPKFTIDADNTGGALGAMFLAVAGDMDGDHVPDVYASDWVNRALGPATGRVYVNSGADGHQIHAFTGEVAGEGFGTSSSVAGDVNGDGYADLIVGAWQFAGAAQSGGKAYLYSGRDGTLLKTFTCRTPGDTFGFDAVSLGDVDRDGIADLLITSAWSGVSGFHSGRVFIISSGIRR